MGWSFEEKITIEAKIYLTYKYPTTFCDPYDTVELGMGFSLGGKIFRKKKRN